MADNRKIEDVVIGTSIPYNDYTARSNIWINVKCDPEWRDFWRSAFEAIVPAYHINKDWIKVMLEGGSRCRNSLVLFRVFLFLFDLCDAIMGKIIRQQADPVYIVKASWICE